MEVNAGTAEKDLISGGGREGTRTRTIPIGNSIVDPYSIEFIILVGYGEESEASKHRHQEQNL